LRKADQKTLMICASSQRFPPLFPGADVRRCKQTFLNTNATSLNPLDERKRTDTVNFFYSVQLMMRSCSNIILRASIALQGSATFCKQCASLRLMPKR